MNEQSKVKIKQLPTGVPGLDEILGGGLPEFSFNIIAGSPGCGKTTLAHQFIFANATVERPALYFTVLGEPALKMLRYQQQFTFFDAAKLNNAVRFVNLSQDLVEHGLEGVLEEISRQVEAANPSIVVVDSFRTVLRSELHEGKDMAVQTFVRQPRLHRCRRPLLALSAGRPELRRAQDADHEAARTGFGAGPAYLSHHRSRSAGLLTHTWSAGPEKDIYQCQAPFHGDSGVGRDDGRRCSGGGQPADRRFLGYWQITDSDAIPCRGHTRGRTRHCSGL